MTIEPNTHFQALRAEAQLKGLVDTAGDKQPSIADAFVTSGTIPPNAEIIDDPGLPLELTPAQQHAIDHGHFMSQQRREMAERELLALTEGMPEWKPKSRLRRAFYALGAPLRMLRRGLIRLLGGST